MNRLLIFILVVFFFAPLPQARAAFDRSLEDLYFRGNFDWAMFIEVKQLKQFLNYKGSKLFPVSKVRIYARRFDRLKKNEEKVPASRIYEEYWYHKGLPVGSRRHFNLDVSPGQQGVVVIGELDSSTDGSSFAANAALRAILDQQLKKSVVNLVLVSAVDYDNVKAGLGNYGFEGGRVPTAGKHMTLILRSYPRGRENQLFLLH